MTTEIQHVTGVPHWFTRILHRYHTRACKRYGVHAAAARLIESSPIPDEMNRVVCNYCGQILWKRPEQ